MSRTGKTLVFLKAGHNFCLRRKSEFSLLKNLPDRTTLKKYYQRWRCTDSFSHKRGNTSSFLCFVQITIFLHQWQKKCILSLFTLNELISISAPRIMHIFQCNLVSFSNNESGFTLSCKYPFLLFENSIVSDKISIFIFCFSNRQECM